MKAYKTWTIAKLLLIASTVAMFSQPNETERTRKLILEAAYIGDNVNNLKGGIKTGSSYLGMANIRIGLNLEKAKLLKGGVLFINAANTHGATPSENLTGDFQVLSNIEAGNHTYIQELWYRQSLGSFEITAGLQDLNVEYANTENGSLYLNSSFGIKPTISGNVPAPIFPLTTLGLSVKLNISQKLTWLGAIYDGCPTDFEDNPYNLCWEFNSEDGVLFISELQHSTAIKGLPGMLKVGFYTHNHYLKVTEMDQQSEKSYETNYGIYAISDQKIWQNPSINKSLGMFVQLGMSPAKFNQNYYYTGIGFNYAGLLDKQGRDIAGLALAYAGLKGAPGNETVLELTYNFPLSANIFIQPDFQYIINPAGTGEKLENCLAATFRFGVNL